MKTSKYIVVYPGGELRRKFRTYKEAYKCAVELSRITRTGIKLERTPEPYKSERIVVAI